MKYYPLRITKVVCCGVFDYEIHEGHKEFLSFAKKQGTRLFVFLVPDYIVEKNKGRKPYYCQEIRVKNVQCLDDVYKAMPMTGVSEEQNQEQIIGFYPDIFVFGPDQDNSWADALIRKLSLWDTRIVRAEKSLKKFSTTELLKMKGLLP